MCERACFLLHFYRLPATERQCVLPAALPPLIALAFLQYSVDSRLPGGRALRGSSIGRWNGIAYYVIVAVPIVRDALALGWPAAGLVTALGWGLVVSTLLSMGDRLRRAGSGRRAPGSRVSGRAGRWLR